MNVQDVMTSNIVSIHPHALLVEAARRMVEKNIGFLPVIENELLIGVVTDRDIVSRGVAEGCNLAQARVGDVMSVEIVCCFAGQSVDEVKELMVKQAVSRLPVIDDQNRVVGVVSSSTMDGPAPGRKMSVKVTFHKEKTDAYGHSHQVPVKTVYITGAPSREAAVEAAVHRFEGEQKTPWDKAANSIDVADDAKNDADKAD